MSRPRPQASEALSLARRIDDTLHNATQLIVMLQKGPYKRRRRRGRKKLALLVDTLSQLQRLAIASSLTVADLQGGARILDRADSLLQRGMRKPMTKARLKKIRRGAMRDRQALHVLLSPTPVEALSNVSPLKPIAVVEPPAV